MDNNNKNEDVLAARRQALAEALKAGDTVVVTPTGEVAMESDVEGSNVANIQVPDGKLAAEA